MHDTNGPLIGLANEQTTTEPRVSKRSPDERSDIWIFLFPSAPFAEPVIVIACLGVAHRS
jgi:hypothetical protein